MRQRIARLALGLYPQAWRERYGEEMAALVEERPPSIRAALDLLRGAADAHLHPGGLRASGLDRMRNSVAAVLFCWIAFVVAGAGFAKLTEDHPFTRAGNAHPLLADARFALTALAVLSAVAVALGGAPLIRSVLAEAWRQRRPRLLRAVLTPLLAVVAFVLATAAVVWLANGPLPRHSALGSAVFVLWSAVGIAAATATGLGSRTALGCSHPRRRDLRLGVFAATVVAAAMAAMTLASAVYVIVLVTQSPGVAGLPGGPFAIDTGLLVAVDVALMAVASGLAALTARRGLSALRA